MGGPAIEATVSMNEAKLMMEVNTGASASVVNETTYRNTLQSCSSKLQPSTVKLHTYTGEELLLRVLPVKVTFHHQTAQLQLIVVQGHGPSLLGGDWLAKLNWTGTTCTRHRPHQRITN